MQLSATDQAKCKFHLGYSYSTPAMDLARLYRAMNEVPDSWTLARLSGLIQRCEDTYNNTLYTVDTLYDNNQETVTYSGSTEDRTTTVLDAQTANERTRQYYNEVEFLATSLGVRNYRNPEQAINAYLMDGGTYIKSIPGADGDGGSIWYSKAGVPTVDEFSESIYDLCLNVDNSDLYQRGESSWALIGNIKGDTGSAGADGADGADGVQWFSKNGVPTDGEFSENIGDFCLDISSGDVYEKTDATTWALTIGLKGEAGAGITWRGEWDNSINYVQYDAVEYNGSSYIADMPSTNKQPDISVEWDLWVEKGDTGATGATGTVTATSALELEQQGTSPTEQANKTLVYAKTDDKLYFKIPDGTEQEVGSGAGGGTVNKSQILAYSIF